ncbi:MAG: UvrD-helicase domain-containing protein [Pseudomonadota bacterium]
MTTGKSQQPALQISQQLNAPQADAVREIGRPMLVLAGAGSGKTRVITYKIAWLLSHHGEDPQSIFAVTFTNKAAREMKQRVSELLDPDLCRGLTVCTFHRLGMTILKEEIRAVGRKSGFSIFDPQDSIRIIKDLLKADVDADVLVEQIRHQISHWKNHLQSADEVQNQAMTSAWQVTAAKVYLDYERYLEACNAVDLDDLIYLPNVLLSKFDNLRVKWRQRVRFMLVDEYQDTNAAQYQLVKLLVGDGAGLTAVGDDDQSIYAWRGAQPENLNQLASDFPNLLLVKLEQNYRSMGRVLMMANHVIKNNPRPFEKTLWSELGFGDPAVIISAENDEREAEKVVANLMQHRFQHQRPYGEYAILYRGNHQSRILEKKLREMRIPYLLSGGQSFFERSEIRDLMAYLRLIANPDDDSAFVRAINTPRRGIGASTLAALSKLSTDEQTSLFHTIASPTFHEVLSPRQQTGLREFANLIDDMVARAHDQSVKACVNSLLDLLDYQQWITKQSASPEQAEARWQNVEDLQAWIASIADNDETRSFDDVIHILGLMGILDKNESQEDSNVVSLMTLHAAKGLEFPHVTIIGLEEELLPHRSSIEDDMVEEERRLFYVGITRAQHQLVLSYARKRARYGESFDCEPSRFIDELPQEHIVWQDKQNEDPSQASDIGAAHLSAMREMLASK